MSFLTLAGNTLDMNKVVISVWFQIPSESAKKIRDGTPAFFWEYRVFQGVVPLLVWGSQQITPVTEVEIYDTGAIDESAGHIMLQRISGTHTAPLQPSTIGVYVGSDPPLPSLLDVHIQTNVKASGTGLLQIATGFTGDYLGNNTAPGPEFGKPIYANVVYTMEDVSYIVTEEPEYLGNSDSNSSSSGAGHPEVKLDAWNHLLISWDLVSHTNTSGSSKMWCAINDENKSGFDLPAMCDPGVGMGPNDHMTYTAFSHQGDSEKPVSVNFSKNNVPSDPVGIPGPLTVSRASDARGGTTPVHPVVRVELAELQIFTGVTLDTGVEKNRRAFIDFERDDNGSPIKDKDGNFTLMPVSPVGQSATDDQPKQPAPAEKLLKKRPEILLHGSSEWINGENTGSLGVEVDTDGNEVRIPSGQFQPTGKINPYTPDPSLSKSGSSTRRKAGPVRLTKTPADARL